MRSMYVLVREFYYHMLIQFQSSLSPAFNAQKCKVQKKSVATEILPDQFKTQMQTELVYTRLAGMLLPKFFKSLLHINIHVRGHTFFPIVRGP